MREVTSTDVVAITAAAAVAAEPFLSTMGVIFMGAFGGALFALLNREAMPLWPGIRFVGARWLLSQFCSWPAMSLVYKWMGSADFSVPQTALLLFVSFVVACPGEFMRELSPLRDVFMRLMPRSKE